jgi:hypothetical protein
MEHLSGHVGGIVRCEKDKTGRNFFRLTGSFHWHVAIGILADDLGIHWPEANATTFVLSQRANGPRIFRNRRLFKEST